MLTKITILVAEDESLNFEYIRLILDGYAVNLHHAKNGYEAIEIFNNHKIDIILMDINMPFINGIEATGFIRKMDSNVPIIAQTANLITLKDCRKFGFSDFISKPLDRKSTRLNSSH